MSASDKAMPGGQPSITQPIAGPWDSPKVVTQNDLPNVLPDIAERKARIGKASFYQPAPAAKHGQPIEEGPRVSRLAQAQDGQQQQIGQRRKEK